ncbi:hypothetical protein C8R44DRAFT_893702 [Mycena epipterygia]|nr:hypothetical protein C8R44DRAFT_893702 [Mycena epipterygia]
MTFCSSLFRLFAREPTPPPAGVRTIACTGLDVGTRDTILTTGFIIDARLDTGKLQKTFSMLVDCKFPRAGARLARRNGVRPLLFFFCFSFRSANSGWALQVYEFQIPRTFDADNPPVAFTAENHSETYRSPDRPELPIHQLSPEAILPSIRPAPELDVYFKSRECPTSLDGFLVHNIPLIHVHVTAFEDLTFIGITSSHIIFDVLGVRTLLHAWTRLINGDDIDTIPGMEWDAAPFESFSTEPVAPPRERGWFDLGLLSQLRLVFPLLLRTLWDPEERRMVHVPKAFLEVFKRQIMEDLRLQGSSEWVGSSDVLMAWWLKTIYGLRHVKDSTPIHVHISVDLRDKRVFPGASTISTPYINNAVLMIAVPPIPANTFRTESLTNLALRIRRAVIAFDADSDGIVAEVQWRCTNPHKMLFPCPSGAEFLLQTNWRKARFGELDFSGACVGQTPRPRVMSFMGKKTNIPKRGMGGVTMEDEHSLWMTQIRGKREWEHLRRSGSVTFI